MAGPLRETEVRPNVFVWTLGGESIATAYGTNCVAVIGREAVLLVDPLIAPAHARLVEESLRRHTAAPVRLLAFTHHHTDHTWGGAWFAAHGAVAVAHRVCRERMAAEHPVLREARRSNPETAELFADAAPVLPEVTFDEGLTLFAGGVEVEAWHAGWGHTPGDAFLFLPVERVAICGDLVFAGYHYNYEDASVAGVRQGLRALRALDADMFIPGHGEVGGPEILDAQEQYHAAVEAIIGQGAAQGMDAPALAAAVEERFPDYRLSIVTPTAVARFKP